MNQVEIYIKSFPAEVQQKLLEIRKTILSVAPDAEEKISYGMPGFYLNNKPLVYFAGYKHHIGFYATPNGHQEFAKELLVYKQGKGSVQFPLNKEIPFDLIRRIVEFRKENQ
ncbi:iron chaperone [Kaistella montana]|uniref:Iron chaperone n=1 Tax=Kaistella montana TaxID=1849733 RepID=A0ABW5K8V9_9FLAO|nr:DUF1801 domain-containing protein [Kaistella montana]MCQ4034666.1 DUF1801 domain-containing protein [Kaistella montana]